MVKPEWWEIYSKIWLWEWAAFFKQSQVCFRDPRGLNCVEPIEEPIEPCAYLVWFVKSNSPYWKHKGIPCTSCTSRMFCSCSQICDTWMHVFPPPSLEDGWRRSVSELHLAAVSTFDVGECSHLRWLAIPAWARVIKSSPKRSLKSRNFSGFFPRN